MCVEERDTHIERERQRDSDGQTERASEGERAALRIVQEPCMTGP